MNRDDDAAVMIELLHAADGLRSASRNLNKAFRILAECVQDDAAANQLWKDVIKPAEDALKELNLKIQVK